MVSFTGSTRAGKRVAEVASQSLKRVALELGGKSANILLDDLDDEDFEKSVRDGVGKAYLNSGQTCTALTRMLVPHGRSWPTPSASPPTRSRRSSSRRTRSPTAPCSARCRSQAQVERVTGYIQKGIDEGAKLVTGGPEQARGRERRRLLRAARRCSAR